MLSKAVETRIDEPFEVRAARGWYFQIWLSSLHDDSGLGLTGMLNIPVRMIEDLSLDYAAFLVSVVKGILYDVTYSDDYSFFQELFGWDPKKTWAIETYFIAHGYIAKTEPDKFGEYRYELTPKGANLLQAYVEGKEEGE